MFSENWLKSALFGSDRVSDFMPLAFTIAAFYGFFRIAKLGFKFCKFLWRHLLRPKRNLYAKFGSTSKKSWAVVTGGSDGYGLDICHKLAAQGFNICMVARNEQKMQEKLAEIKNPEIEKKCIVADFFKMTTIEEYQAAIGDKLKDDDVALVFLNAGVGQVGPFYEVSGKRLEYVMNIKALHPIYTAKVLVNQLRQRKERSAIVVTSSGLGSRPVAGCVVYSAANACSSFMAQALRHELKKDNVDVMSWEAGAAATKMFPQERRAKMRPVGPCVDAMLADLSNGEPVSYGSRAQHYQHSLFYAMPDRFIQPMMFGGMTKSYHAELERMKKEGTSMDEYL